jgi:hypothetical protein
MLLLANHQGFFHFLIPMAKKFGLQKVDVGDILKIQFNILKAET